MERPSLKTRIWKPLLAVILLAVGFVGGQVLPTVVPAAWQVGRSHLNFNDLNDTYDLLKSKFDGAIDESKVMDGARAGVISAAGDPYTVYLDAKSAKALNDQLSGTLSGIGAEVGIKNNKLTVIAPIEGSPAAQAGLRTGDYIASIDKVDSSSLTLDEAVAKIRGQAGTKVTIVVVRGSNAPLTLTITRQTITVPSVKWSLKSGSIGFINVTTFGSDTATKIAQAASELKGQGATKIILDVRDDPGGYLDAAVAVSSQFEPAGKLVVDERTKGSSRQKLYTQDGGALVGLPTVVLINGGSASASEIVAGSLHDNGYAKLIGAKSFGKGSVQEITQLAGGAEVKITVAHWYRPNGTNIDKKGITPDITVDLTADDVNAGRDPQLDRAIQELSK